MAHPQSLCRSSTLIPYHRNEYPASDVVTIDDIVVLPPAEGETLDPATLFPTPGPVELEIGCGKGGFLLSRARAHPEVRLLGIEWANKYYRFCADRLARWQITNARVMRTDASLLVQHQLPPACLDALHVYHPDPWPKKRHHRRRLIQPPFSAAVVRVLKPGGIWRVQSDHEEYFQQIREVLDGQVGLRAIPWEPTEQWAGDAWEGTNFQIKYERDGKPIYRAAYRLETSAAAAHAQANP
jgi:tRNA (guanine-N7-)-methyltransferase